MNNVYKGRLLAFAQFGLIILAVFLSYYFKNNSSSIFKLTGIIIMFIGIVIGIISIINFAQLITPNPVPLKDSHLITSGLYKYIRHPMYLSVMISILGCCIYFMSVISILSMFILFIFFVYKVRFEESILKEKYPSYIEYTKTTYRFIPFIY